MMPCGALFSARSAEPHADALTVSAPAIRPCVPGPVFRVLHYWKDERCLGAPIGTIKLKYCTGMKSGGDCKWEFAVPSSATSDKRFQIATDTRTYQMFTAEIADADDWITKITESLKQAHTLQLDKLVEVKPAEVTGDEEFTALTGGLTFDNDDDEDEDEEDRGDVDFADSGGGGGGGNSDDEEDGGELDEEAGYFVDRYLDMYNLPHTKLRRKMLLEAIKIGRSSHKTKRHMHIIYNPTSGSGLAKKNVDDTVVPVLEVAGIDFKVTFPRFIQWYSY